MGVHLVSPPGVCAACYQSPTPGARYVDFGAATDGPVVVLPGGAIRSDGMVTVEEIVLCDACVRAGAMALGSDAEREPIEQARAAQAAAEQDAAMWRDRARALQHAAAAWATPQLNVAAIKDGRGKGRFTEPEKTRVLEALNAGRPVKDIAAEIGVAPQTIINWRHKRDREEHSA